MTEHEAFMALNTAVRSLHAAMERVKSAKDSLPDEAKAKAGKVFLKIAGAGDDLHSIIKKHYKP